MVCYCCRNFLSFLLKFLNFLQLFVGVSIILYSIWMLDHWNQNHSQISPSFPPSSVDVFPGPLSLYGPNIQNGRDDGFDYMGSNGGVIGLSENVQSGKFLAKVASGFDFNFDELPAPWFIYSFMGIGVLLCLINCIGHISAEAFNGCCLCFYTMLITILLLLEAALVGDIVLNKHWEEDLPYDPTGEFESVRSFIEDNINICKWVGIVVVVIQVLSLLMAMILRAMISTRTTDYDSDDDYAILRGGRWHPQLNPQGGQTHASSSFDGKGIHPDVWSTRMREKYGLNHSEFPCNMVDGKPYLPVKNNVDQGWCSII